ncbi:Arc family DNA-binding protein [Acetobacter lovaniensis]
MAREDSQFRIRLPAELKDALEEAALASGSSFNAEITERLARSFWPKSETDADRAPEILSKKISYLHQDYENAESAIEEILTAINKIKSQDYVSDEIRGFLIKRLAELENEKKEIDQKLRLLDFRRSYARD